MKHSLTTLILAISTFPVEADTWKSVDKIPGTIKSTKIVIPIYTQKVAFQMPTTWKPAFKDQKPNMFMMEFTPKDENLNSWKNMLTVQGYKNLADRFTPQKFLIELSSKFKLVCGSNVVYEPVGHTKINGHKAFSAIIGCSKLPNKNISEIGYYISIQGDNDLYIINKSIRTEAFEPNNSPLTISNVNNYISKFMPIELCKIDGHAAECNK